jgi:hypothetical protein
MRTLTRMHDWTLVGLTLNWRAGSLALDFKTADGPVVVNTKGLTFLEVPRRHEWGPSVSVNEVRLSTVSKGQRLDIEMQSGDEIVIIAATIELPPGTEDGQSHG